MARVIIGLLLSWLVLGSALAQESDTTTVLLPITAPTIVSGAYGTAWQTDIWVHNGSDGILGIWRDCNIIIPCAVPNPPGKTTPLTENDLGSAVNAVQLTIPSAARHLVTFTARLLELSRHTQPVGVDVPVIFEDEFFTEPVRFVAISGNPASRVALRVYHVNLNLVDRTNGSVRIDFFRPDGTSIATGTLQMAYPGDVFTPGYAAIYDLAAAFPHLQGIDRYDVVVSPLKAGMQFYALMSTTDVDTQQVLLITTKQ